MQNQSGHGSCRNSGEVVCQKKLVSTQKICVEQNGDDALQATQQCGSTVLEVLSDDGTRRARFLAHVEKGGGDRSGGAPEPLSDTVQARVYE